MLTRHYAHDSVEAPYYGCFAGSLSRPALVWAWRRLKRAARAWRGGPSKEGRKPMGMLVLSRKRDETIEVGGPRTIHVDLDYGERALLATCTDHRLQRLAARLLAATPGPVTVTTVDIRGDKVRLGITAPKDVPVHRSEVAADIAAGNTKLVQKIVRATPKGLPAPAVTT